MIKRRTGLEWCGETAYEMDCERAACAKLIGECAPPGENVYRASPRIMEQKILTGLVIEGEDRGALAPPLRETSAYLLLLRAQGPSATPRPGPHFIPGAERSAPAPSCRTSVPSLGRSILVDGAPCRGKANLKATMVFPSQFVLSEPAREFR